ncbi:hypothetical protein [Streptomyces sp. NPDC058466]|uniref:hypothetical protein n=1 Tax=Streptomyces sp. NPDC058466 TaxID=3346512 RepID=UPI003661E47C
MYLVYKPDGQEEPTRYKYQPQKLMSAEREMLERRTERNFSEFHEGVMKGNSLCRRALLFMYTKREHPTVKWDDVDFAWDELDIEYSKTEWIEMRDTASENLRGDQLAMALEAIEKAIPGAYEDPDESGKASSPLAV